MAHGTILNCFMCSEYSSSCTDRFFCFLFSVSFFFFAFTDVSFRLLYIIEGYSVQKYYAARWRKFNINPSCIYPKCIRVRDLKRKIETGFA